MAGNRFPQRACVHGDWLGSGNHSSRAVFQEVAISRQLFVLFDHFFVSYLFRIETRRYSSSSTYERRIFYRVGYLRRALPLLWKQKRDYDRYVATTAA